MAALRTSPLHQRHVDLGARFAEFGGWSMPVQYSSVVAEHRAVRSGVGVFDVSHLGKARVAGPGARAFVNTCFTNDLNRIEPQRAQYTLCCAESGGVVDDLIQYLVSDDEVFLIPNAANTARVVELLRDAAGDDLTVADLHDAYAIIAVQGPESGTLLASLGARIDVDYMAFGEAVIAGRTLTVCRTGYTGELGYELVCAWDDAVAVWDAVLAAGQPLDVLPCGLGARDTLRTEMGYPLHGHELSLEISPVTAGLSWAVGWDKPSFWGADALRAERAAGPARRLRALKAAGRAIPRSGMDVLDADGAVIGVVTSGTFSPTLEVGIGLALIDAHVLPGAEVRVSLRGRVESFAVVKPPLVHPQVRSD